MENIQAEQQKDDFKNEYRLRCILDGQYQGKTHLHYWGSEKNVRERCINLT